MTAVRDGDPVAMLRAESVSDFGDLLDIGVLTVDRSQSIIGWNGWLERATGISARDAVGRTLAEVSPSVRPSTLSAINRALDGGTVVLSHAFHEFLIECKPPAGFEHMERMQQSVRILPVKRGDGESVAATIFIEDVTERVSRELELRQAIATAQAANEARSQFFTAMSHELRTPIGAISGYASLIADELFGPVTGEQREHLGRIKSVASHLQHIVNEILSLSRVEAGREDLDLRDADAVTLAREAVIAVAPLAAQKGLELREQLAPDALPMHTDPVKVRQILINLLGNAIKFTERGFIEITVAERGDSDVIAFGIADTGPGIPPEDLGRIFEPFTRLRRTPLTKPGTGLGLAVSRGFARRLGGDIVVASQLGAGSRFTALIPRSAVV